MRKQIGCILIFLAWAVSTFAQATSGIEGKWLGTLEFNGIKVRLVLNVVKASDGALSATFDSPDQGASGLPIDSVTQKDKTVAFEAKQFGMTFEGTLNEKGDEIAGTFKQGNGSSPLVF